MTTIADRYPEELLTLHVVKTALVKSITG